MEIKLTKLPNKVTRKLTMINKFYKYTSLIFGLTLATNTLSNANNIYADFECAKDKQTNNYLCIDSFKGSEYWGEGVMKNGWFIPKTKNKSNDNNVVGSLFGIFSNPTNSDNAGNSIEASNKLLKKISVRFKDKNTQVQYLKKEIKDLKTQASTANSMYSEAAQEKYSIQNKLLNVINKKKSVIRDKDIELNSLKRDFNSLKKQKYNNSEIYIFFAVLLFIVAIILINRNHRINVENAKDRQIVIDSLASKDAKKEIESAKDKIVREANDQVYKKTVRLAELKHSTTRVDAIKEVKDKIKGEYEKSVDREKLKQDVFAKIKKEILDNISKAEQKEIKLHAMNDLKQKMTEELIASHSKEVSANLDIVEIKKEAEKAVKDKHFIEIMDEVRKEYKKTVFDNLSDKEIEDLKKEVYLEVKQGLTKKSSTKPTKKNTSSALDDFIDSL